MSDKTKRAALLAFDCGTSMLRAFLLGADGVVLAQRSRPWGISSLPDGGYPAAFTAITANWPIAALPAIASGMVGSRTGWKQINYLTTPCDPSELARGLDLARCPLPDGGEIALHLVPGLLDPTGPDVMRGEETEAIGALDALGHPAGDLFLVLPGTHSKWLRVSDGVLRGFSTYMTGELFAVLNRHSILAMPADLPSLPDAMLEQVFADAVRDAAGAGLSGELFRTRARMLTGELGQAATAEHLSGLLIGEELSHASRGGHVDGIVLVGDPALCGRYARAFAALDRPAPRILEAAAARGLFRIAVSAGLLDAAGGGASC